MFWERMSFSGFTVFSSVTTIASLQGVNMLLNRFYGVAVNAAMGVMNQVGGAVNSFLFNIFAAINPQIVKSCASGDFANLHTLLVRSCKFSCLIMSLIVFPLAINIDFVLHLWLKVVPDYTVAFCQVRLIDWLMGTLVGPLAMVIVGAGRVKKYYLVDSALVSINFFGSWLFLASNLPLEKIQWTYVAINVVRLGFNLYFTQSYVQFSALQFVRSVMRPILLVLAISLPIPYLLGIHMESGWQMLFATGASFLALFLPSALFLGMSKRERTLIFDFVKRKLNRKAAQP
jgi:hypothetical protein